MIKELKISHSITERTPTLSRYMQDITRYPLLNMDEEVELATLAQRGDERAKEQLVNSNLRFVISIAKQYLHQGVPLEDLIMEGNIGLINAINKFDPTRGFKLSTYAVWWIRQAILHALAEKGRSVRLPLNQVGLLTRVKKASCATGGPALRPCRTFEAGYVHYAVLSAPYFYFLRYDELERRALLQGVEHWVLTRGYRSWL
jgi:RNA polymerase primary sigma factor